MIHNFKSHMRRFVRASFDHKTHDYAPLPFVLEAQHAQSERGRGAVIMLPSWRSATPESPLGLHLGTAIPKRKGSSHITSFTSLVRPFAR